MYGKSVAYTCNISVMTQTLRATGPWNVIFFVITIFFGAFYLLNMMMAVVSLAYAEEGGKEEQEEQQDKQDKAREQVFIQDTANSTIAL
jgi:cytochrome bd-type quinol oxidase subunit 1